MRLYYALLPAALLLATAGCNPGTKAAENTTVKPGATGGSHLQKLVIKDTKVGTGDAVKPGDQLWVQYTGKLKNGHVFDSSKNHEDGKPFDLVLGAGSVIKGWDEGLVGMKVGGTRELQIPADLAYGNQDKGDIPPNSDLYFTIDLVDAWSSENRGILVANDVKKGTGPAVKKGDTITIEYTASTLGTEFESTARAGKPLTIHLGKDDFSVVGFDDALMGMQAGGERIIKAPPETTRMVGMDRLGMTVATYDVKLKSIK